LATNNPRHFIFDDKFTTIPSMNTVAERDAKLVKLFESAAECFVEIEDLKKNHTLLDDEWLSPEELAEKGSTSSQSDVDSDNEEGSDVDFDGSDFSPDDDLEGAAPTQPPPTNPPAALLQPLQLLQLLQLLQPQQPLLHVIQPAVAPRIGRIFRQKIAPWGRGP
jgi:hypothetical protein